jgi:hypothetical protein
LSTTSWTGGFELPPPPPPPPWFAEASGEGDPPLFWQIPLLQVWFEPHAPQLPPQLPPQPSEPQTLPEQSGVQFGTFKTQLPLEQIFPLAEQSVSLAQADSLVQTLLLQPFFIISD